MNILDTVAKMSVKCYPSTIVISPGHYLEHLPDYIIFFLMTLHTLLRKDYRQRAESLTHCIRLPLYSRCNRQTYQDDIVVIAFIQCKQTSRPVYRKNETKRVEDKGEDYKTNSYLVIIDVKVSNRKSVRRLFFREFFTSLFFFYKLTVTYRSELFIKNCHVFSL